MNIRWMVIFQWIHFILNVVKANNTCPGDWKILGGNGYFFSTTKKNLYGAAVACPGDCQHPVHVNSPRENELLQRYFQANGEETYWMYLRKLSPLGGDLTTRREEWEWWDGAVYSWHNWGENQPTGNYRYAVITATGKWEDRDGDDEHLYICEKKENDPLTNASTDGDVTVVIGSTILPGVHNETSHDTSTALTPKTTPSISRQKDGLYIGVSVGIPVIVIIAILIIIVICMMHRRKLRAKIPSSSGQKEPEGTSAEMALSVQEPIETNTPEIRVESPYIDLDRLSISNVDDNENEQSPHPTELAKGAPIDGNHPQPVYAMVDKTQKVKTGGPEDNPVISDVYALPNKQRGNHGKNDGDSEDEDGETSIMENDIYVD